MHDVSPAGVEDSATTAQVLQCSSDAIVWVNDAGEIVRTNPAFSRLVQRPESDLQGVSILECLPLGRQGDSADVSSHPWMLARAGAVLPREPYELLRATGPSVSVEVSAFRAPSAAVLVIRDVTDRRRLVRLCASIWEALEQWHQGVLAVGNANEILFGNRTARETLGYDEDELRQRLLSEIVCADAEEEVRSRLAAMGSLPDASRYWPMPDVYRRKDGSRFPVEYVRAPSAGTVDDALALLVVFNDVSRQHSLHTALLQAQKLEAIGQLAVGIAHEINTPTQYLLDNTSFLQQSFTVLVGLIERQTALLRAAETEGKTEGKENRDGAGLVVSRLLEQLRLASEAADLAYLTEEIPKAIDHSLEGLHRISKIVGAMKEFSHPTIAEGRAHVDINSALETTVTVSRNEWKYVAEVRTDFDPALPSVPCSPGEINQVFLNVIVNAAHAIADARRGEERGTITIATRAIDRFAEIRISDTGTGIPERIRDRVFDAFFTTKDVGRGTGQGLSIARSIVVDKHRGTISFETKVGEGTTFVVRLPFDGGEENGS
ncbi:MAG: ATP-binding protein [Pseudomonadota bacterium]